MSKFNDAWNEIFTRYDIVSLIEEKGYFDITANDIKKVKEPRLLTKQDHRKDRPVIFQENELNILPLSRNVFRIGHVEMFHDFETKWDDATDDVIDVSPCDVNSIDFDNITSEAIAIKSMYCTHILNDFLEEESLRDTVSGRMGSGVFDFDITNIGKDTISNIKVDNAQIEIDGGYESPHSLCLIESKLNLAHDFNVRQLYFPYRCWQQRINKPIRPVFFVYSNGIYHVMEYSFEDPNCFNSIHLLRYKRYRIGNDTITIDDLNKISQTCEAVTEPDVPFPQADSLERVINLCMEMKRINGSMTKEDIWLFFSFSDRQADYYANAGIYIGLIEKSGKSEYCLSVIGKNVFGNKTTIRQRNLTIVKLLLSHGVIKDCFNYRLHSRNSGIHDYEKIIRRHKECNIGESLYGRRSSTISHWIKWIFNLAEE